MSDRIVDILLYRLIPGVLLGVLVYYGTTFYQESKNLEDYNKFLEVASATSEIHYLSSQSFLDILDFNEINRESFETTISNIVVESQKAYDLLMYSELSELNIKEKELLEIAVGSWLKGLESFESSILILVDQPSSKKIEENIASSIADLSIGDSAYSEFLLLMRIRGEESYIPYLYEVEYIGVEDSSSRFADLLVEKAKESSGGLFLRRDISIPAIQFEPAQIAETEDNLYVFKDEPLTLKVIISNEGNRTEYDLLLLVLITDEQGNTVYEKQQKEAFLEPLKSKTVTLDSIQLIPGIKYDWLIKLEEVENEEEIDDNLYRVEGFIPFDS
jgi:hypothetical protein|tara:strand:- start:1641 stop:2633 length:993 start_codon:yes stop_codon:yes gene_type:complete